MGYTSAYKSGTSFKTVAARDKFDANQAKSGLKPLGSSTTTTPKSTSTPKVGSGGVNIWDAPSKPPKEATPGQDPGYSSADIVKATTKGSDISFEEFDKIGTPQPEQISSGLKDQTANILFNRIKSGELVPNANNPAWTAFYQNGQATQAQQDAFKMWEDYNNQQNTGPTAQELFDQIQKGTLIADKNNPAWNSLYVNGEATQAQKDAFQMWQDLNNQKPGQTSGGDTGDFKTTVNNEANSDQEKELAIIESQTNQINLSESAQLTEKLLKALEEKSSEPVKTLEQVYADKRSELGLVGLEGDLSSISAEIAQLDADYLSTEEGTEQQRAPMGSIRRNLSETQLQYSRKKRDLMAERDSIANELNMKYGILNTMVNIIGQDMASAERKYDADFNKALQLINLVKADEAAEATAEERRINNAQANIQVMANLLKEGNINYEELDAATLLDIKKMEMQAGLPVGFTSFVNKAIEAPISQFLATYTDDRGHKIQPVGVKMPDGSFSVQNIDLGPVFGQDPNNPENDPDYKAPEPGLGSNYKNVTGNPEDAFKVPDDSTGGQCGRYVNNYTNLGLGDSYQNKISKMDPSITTPEAGMVFVMPYKTTGHTGFILSIDGDKATVKDSNWSLDEKVQTHVVSVSSMTGFARVTTATPTETPSSPTPSQTWEQKALENAKKYLPGGSSVATPTSGEVYFN